MCTLDVYFNYRPRYRQFSNPVLESTQIVELLYTLGNIRMTYLVCLCVDLCFAADHTPDYPASNKILSFSLDHSRLHGDIVWWRIILSTPSVSAEEEVTSLCLQKTMFI